MQIFYPGSSGDPEYIEPEPQVFSLPVPSPVPTTTTTTPYPVVVQTRRQPPQRRPAPTTTTAPIAPAPVPVATVRAPARRRRPQSQTRPRVVENRLETIPENVFEEIAEDENIKTLTEDEEARRYREEQARNAHYTFGTSIDDSINDHSIHRQETRKGLALKGMYSYSDGYFKRTIHYEADENGYRVVK